MIERICFRSCWLWNNQLIHIHFSRKIKTKEFQIFQTFTWLAPPLRWSSCDACVWLCDGIVKSRKSKSVPCVSAPPMSSCSSVSKKVRVWELVPYASTLIAPLQIHQLSYASRERGKKKTPLLAFTVPLLQYSSLFLRFTFYDNAHAHCERRWQRSPSCRFSFSSDWSSQKFRFPRNDATIRLQYFLQALWGPISVQ